MCPTGPTNITTWCAIALNIVMASEIQRQLQALFQKDISVCLFDRSKACKHDILRTNKPILAQIGTRGSRGKGMKRSTLGVRRSKVKVTMRPKIYWRHGGGIILDPLCVEWVFWFVLQIPFLSATGRVTVLYTVTDSPSTFISSYHIKFTHNT